MTEKQENTTVKLENATVKIVTVLGFMGVVVYAAWEASAFKTTVATEFTGIKTTLERFNKTLDKLDDKIVGKSPEGFHRRDAHELCLAMELTNKSWKCPNPYDLPGYQRFSSGSAKPAKRR